MRNSNRKNILITVIACSCLFLHFTQETVVSQGTETAKISDIAWLEGIWTGENLEAAYSGSEGGVILSAIKAINAGNVVFFEFEYFAQDGNNVVLTPYPGGNKSKAGFNLTGFDPEVKKAVFVNKNHNWPKNITYEIGYQRCSCYCRFRCLRQYW